MLSYIPSTHPPNIPLYSLFTEIVSSVFKLGLFHLLECPPAPILADKSQIILQGLNKTLYLLRLLRSTLL